MVGEANLLPLHWLANQVVKRQEHFDSVLSVEAKTSVILSGILLVLHLHEDFQERNCFAEVLISEDAPVSQI